MASSEQEACLRKTTYRRSTGGQKNLNISKAPVACCLTLELERQGVKQAGARGRDDILDLNSIALHWNVE